MKLTKVKHWFLVLSYILSMIVAFVVMCATQDSNGYSAMWFLGNIFLITSLFVIKNIICLVKNWNKEIQSK